MMGSMLVLQLSYFEVPKCTVDVDINMNIIFWIFKGAYANCDDHHTINILMQQY